MPRIKMYTCFTDSHKEMFERYFQPSVPDSFELFPTQFEQECTTGEYHSDGWIQAVSRKVEVILGAIESVRNDDGPDYFVFSDCDIQFFSDLSGHIHELMQTYDFIAMDDNFYCTGFMGIHANDHAKFMWEWIGEHLAEYGCDQPAGNGFLKLHRKAHRAKKYLPRFMLPAKYRQHLMIPQMRVGMFPRIEYFNHMHLGTEPSEWDPNSPITFTDEQLGKMRMMHANFTMGIQNKIKLLEIVGEQKRRFDSHNASTGSTERAELRRA